MVDGILKILPEVMMIYILMRFQIKSLMRLKCVSKTWYTLLQSSYFINFHLNRTTSAKDEFVLLNRSFQEEPNKYKSILSFLLHVDGHIDLIPVSPDLDVPYLTTTNSCIFHQLLGPCRGLLLLTDSESIVVFNPTTRNYRLLKPSTFTCPLGFYHEIKGVAFGFDSVVNDYKVVRISEVIGDPPFYDFNVRAWKVEVYDLIIDSWRDVEKVHQQLPSLCWYPCSEIFYRGALSLMPDSCDFNDGKCYGLIVLNESLTLPCYPNPGNVPKPGKGKVKENRNEVNLIYSVVRICEPEVGSACLEMVYDWTYELQINSKVHKSVQLFSSLRAISTSESSVRVRGPGQLAMTTVIEGPTANPYSTKGRQNLLHLQLVHYSRGLRMNNDNR
ncbi:hypothetical protein HAX54_031481, partial [Datura stramonium]|nr:hypothetical protein [Datura stramonium]